MVLRGMRHRAAQAGLTALIALVRPTMKRQFPYVWMRHAVTVEGVVLQGA